MKNQKVTKIEKIIENQIDVLSDGFVIELSGEDMIDMAWEIGNDSPEDEYELRVYIEDEEITCAIMCSNGEYNDSGFSFEYDDSLIDLYKNGFIQ